MNWLKRHRSLFFAAAFLAGFLLGCPKPDQIRDGLAANYGFITTAQAQNKADCLATPTLAKCVTINKAIGLHDAALDVFHIYCAGPPAAAEKSYADGGPCSPVKGLQTRLEAAVAELNRIIPDVKALIH